MTLRTKLVFGFLLVGMLAGVVGLTGALTSKKVSGEFNQVTQETMPSLQALYDLRFAGVRIVSSTTEYAFLAAEGGAEGTPKEASEGEEDEKVLVEEGKWLFQRAISRYRELVRLYNPKEEVFLKQIESAGQTLQKLGDEFIKLKEKRIAGSRSLAKKEEFEEAERDFLKVIQAAIEYESTMFETKSETVQQSIYTTARAIIVVVSLCLLLALGISIYMSRSISIPVRRLRDAALKVGKGQLDTPVEVVAKDEIGVLAETFNHMRLSLKNRLEELKEAHEHALREERLSLVGKMAATIIHDFRGPMQIIQGSTEILAMHNLDEEKKERHRRIIIQQIDRLANMTQELLDFARGESHTSRAVVDVEDLLTEVNFQAEELCRNSPLRVDTELKMPFQLWGDKEKFLRVVMNLIRNAKEAMTAGGTIKVSAFLDRMEGVIQVADNGAGIPLELTGRLFQPFATHGKTGGTGLGLALSKKIVEDHGGTIQCESETGKGATFSIRLPGGERKAIEAKSNFEMDKVPVQ